MVADVIKTQCSPNIVFLKCFLNRHDGLLLWMWIPQAQTRVVNIRYCCSQCSSLNGEVQIIYFMYISFLPCKCINNDQECVFQIFNLILLVAT